MNVRCFLAALALALSVPAVAGDSPIYESFRGVSIGRVFLSQEHRDALDKRRLQVPRRVSGATQPAAERRARRTTPPAGYIIGPSGRSKTWRDGDFVETGSKSVRRMPFPGDVTLKRHPAPETSASDGDAN